MQNLTALLDAYNAANGNAQKKAFTVLMTAVISEISLNAKACESGVAVLMAMTKSATEQGVMLANALVTMDKFIADKEVLSAAVLQELERLKVRLNRFQRPRSK